MIRTLVFNGWAAGPEAWALCSFPHDWLFSYVEQLDGLPEKVIADFDEVVLVGFSMGGNYAAKMLLKFPEKVRGLVLVSTSPFIMEDKATGWKGMSERRLAALRLGTGLVFENDGSATYAPENLDRGLVYLRESDVRAPLRELMDGPNGDALRRIPVSVFQSERDGIVRPANVEFWKEVFPQAKVTMVPGNEHVLPVSVPDLISEQWAAVSGSWFNTDACKMLH